MNLWTYTGNLPITVQESWTNMHWLYMLWHLDCVVLYPAAAQWVFWDFLDEKDLNSTWELSSQHWRITLISMSCLQWREYTIGRAYSQQQRTQTHTSPGYDCPDTTDKRTAVPKILFSHREDMKWHLLGVCSKQRQTFTVQRLLAAAERLRFIIQMEQKVTDCSRISNVFKPNKSGLLRKSHSASSLACKQNAP